MRERCLSTLGKEQVEKMHFSSDADEVNEWLLQTREFRRLMEEVEDFPLQYFYDVRESIVRIRVENTHLEEDELFDLRRSLSTIDGIVKILNHSDDDEAEQEDGWRREKNIPTLHCIVCRLTSCLFPNWYNASTKYSTSLARYATTLPPSCCRYAES